MAKLHRTLKKLFNALASVRVSRIRQLRRVKIGRRLAAGFLSIALIVLLGNAFIIWQFYKVRAEVDRLFTGDQELIAVLRFQIELRSFYTRLNELIESKDKDRLIAESEELHKALLNDAKRTEALFKDVPPGSRLGSEVEVAVTAVQSSLPYHLAVVRSLAESGDWEVLQVRLMRQVLPLETISADLVNEVDADIANERAQAATSMARAQNRMLLIFLLTATCTFIIAGIVGAAITGSITEPLRSLEDASAALALGDFRSAIETSGNDELSHLGKALNDTIQKLEALASERKLAEEAVRRSEANLAEAQRLTHTGSFVWQASTREAVHLSDEWYRLYEFDPKKGLPSFEERLERIHPEDRAMWRATLERAIRERSDYELDTRLLLPSGITRHLHTIGHRVLNASGDVVEFVGTVTDITERKQAEEDLREARLKLSNASRIATVAELSASIAHELNQPLTSVVANAQAARRWLKGNPPNFSEGIASIERVLRDGRAADERMQHIRALFKRESFEKREAWISALVSEAIRFVREDPKKADVPIEVQVDDGLPAVLVDPIQIQQVLINLVSNGIEAMQSHHRPPHLKIRASLVNEHAILIEVIDNGPGLQDAKKIFDAFVTTKESGMGIGLAVSRSIIEAHDGKLWAENNSDYGAKFAVQIPAVEIHDHASY